MSGNVLWTTIFNEPTSQATELTRDRIRQHDRVGRRPASIVPGPLFEEAIRGRDTHGLVKMDDPWVPPRERHSLPPPLVGYGGTFPRVRPEHTGKNMGEQAAQFIPHFGTASYRKTANMAPGGGASALGTKPLPIPGSKTPIGVGIYDQLLVVRAADPLIGKVQ
ncbi:hypothetical protein Ctob_010942 [Chrysochromulina tobinii]|uniref:Uncharacterized protein n=1 Tax=Chrysochromulina tobinii TaxID=1460289 RepID=A0A0M0KAF7_9EUKA|nr:hypothetical protein Ctob_010942 [Chrysochromulina tobinii]|eukprot:KOO35826.1 hypothetical protein Ctob_010942 [Chrysochromulina sp. CCMP291]